MRTPVEINGVTVTNLYKPPSSDPSEWPASEFTGEPVDPYSQEWRHECECRHILDGMTSRAQRASHIDGIERFRGKPSADKIRADILLIHYFRQARECKSREALDDLTARIRTEQRLAVGIHDLINRIIAEWLRRFK